MEVTLSDKYIEEVVQARVDKRTEQLQEVVKTYQDQNTELKEQASKRLYKYETYTGFGKSASYVDIDEITKELKEKDIELNEAQKELSESQKECLYLERNYSSLKIDMCLFNSKTFLQKLGFILRGEKLNV